MTFPARRALTILAAHPAYRIADALARRAPDLRVIEATTREDAAARLPEADVLCVSGFWRDDWLEHARKLRFIQSISAGVDQYDRAKLAARHVRLASAHGVNARAVAEHAMALILSMSRRLHDARDLQRDRIWTGMSRDPAERQDELGGKTLLIVGFGLIGAHLAHLARAFGMKVLAVKRDASSARGVADELHATGALRELLPRADIVALACPLTSETRGLIDAGALAAMKPGATLVNVARGAVVDEQAMIDALTSGRLAAAGLDCFAEEPLPAQSPLWGFRNVVLTHHVAGETRAYEDNVVDILLDNIARLERGDRDLRNQVV